MYSYVHDPETGGLLLTDVLSSNSKEPRPVYARELDILGFDQFWTYEQQDEAPYLWAEANFYWYRGKRVAHTSGGSLYEKPSVVLEKDEKGHEVLPSGSTLERIDVARMVEKNRDMIAVIEKTTTKKIYDVYRRYKNKLDCFHVAFSGGKDSIVLLELVKRALPKTAFLVLFGDTGMEFPDTYDVIDKVEEQCKQDGIAFYRAQSKFKPEESWQLFGPPSRILRWCCTVHKAVPQTLKIREILGKNDYTELAFVGVRGTESVARSEYDYEIDGKKIKGQKSFNAILEWNSAEIWLYIFTNKLIVNYAYIQGNQRVGCVYCPMSLKTDYLKNYCYPGLIKKFEEILKKHYQEEDITNGYWCARSNGTLLNQNEQKIFTRQLSGFLEIEVKKPATNFEEWLKISDRNNLNLSFEYKKDKDGFTVVVPDAERIGKNAQIGVLKTIIRKSAYCCMCRACEANCRLGCISFKDGFHIDGCIHCLACCTIQDGCLLYSSLKFPNSNGENSMKVSIDSFGSHAPKTDWFIDFFKHKNDFLKHNDLGPEQIIRFRKFLRAADLIDSKGITAFANLLERMGWNSEESLGLMLINLVSNNAQIKWYIQNLTLNRTFSRQEVIDMLTSQGYSMISSKFVTSAYKRICDLPFGTRIKLGVTTENGRVLSTLTRTKMVPPDPRVLLYGLFKFAEACEGYYEFTLSRLMDFNVESAGVSPAEIFGLDRDELEQFLHGLARKYPDFISFATTHDLEVIRLADDKKSEDVLTLF